MYTIVLIVIIFPTGHIFKDRKVYRNCVEPQNRRNVPNIVPSKMAYLSHEYIYNKHA